MEAVCAPFSFEAAHRILLVVLVGLWGFLRNQVVPRWNIVPVLVQLAFNRPASQGSPGRTDYRCSSTTFLADVVCVILLWAQ